MLLPRLIDCDTHPRSNALSGYINSSHKDGVRVNFTLRPDLGYLSTGLFMGRDCVDAKLIDFEKN